MCVNAQSMTLPGEFFAAFVSGRGVGMRARIDPRVASADCHTFSFCFVDLMLEAGRKSLHRHRKFLPLDWSAYGFAFSYERLDQSQFHIFPINEAEEPSRCPGFELQAPSMSVGYSPPLSLQLPSPKESVRFAPK